MGQGYVLHPQLAIEAAVLDGFRDVLRLNDVCRLNPRPRSVIENA